MERGVQLVLGSQPGGTGVILSKLGGGDVSQKVFRRKDRNFSM